jgi:photosystem II stability/assembly factor-like uncharacterized protein
MKRALIQVVIITVSQFLVAGCASRAEDQKQSSGISAQCVRDRHTRISSQRADQLYFLNPHLGWVILGRGLYQTVDGGKTWTLLNGNDLGLQAVIFVDQLNGWGYVDAWQTERRSSLVFR